MSENQKKLEELLISGQWTVAELTNHTNLSKDQVRRALKKIEGLRTMKVGRTASYTLKRERKRRDSMSSRAESLISVGKSNKYVLEVLVREFDVDPVKRASYPNWFRARLVRQGKITKEFADQNR